MAHGVYRLYLFMYLQLCAVLVLLNVNYCPWTWVTVMRRFVFRYKHYISCVPSQRH